MKSLQAAALSAVTLALVYFGAVHPVLTRALVRAEFGVSPEIIKTTGLQLPVEYPGKPVSRFEAGEPYWKVAEADDWLLLNGPRGTEICPQVLADFGEANASVESMTPDAIRRIAFDFKGKTVSLRVFVPRFRTAPAHLQDCPELRYDAATRTVMRANKRLAYLSPSQPDAGYVPVSK